MQRNAEINSKLTEHELNEISGRIISAAIEVHRETGPGLLESVYEHCLLDELRNNGLFVMKQVLVPITYKGKPLNKDFFIDILVENEVIVELKALEVILPVHEVQLVTYLKLADKRLGLLINFNVPRLIDGVRRKVNHL